MKLILLAQLGMDAPSLTPDVLLLFLVIFGAVTLFVWEPIPIDVTAIGVMVSLILLEPWTDISPTDGVAGFSSAATLTVLAMFVLSEGIRRTGLVNKIGQAIADRYGESPFKQLLSVVGLSGGTAGFINNTPVVAIMIPMVKTLSRKTGISPSRLLMPISFIAMAGGMLTVIGTSTNILASDVWVSVGQRLNIGEVEPFHMFEFTHLGLIVLATCAIYMLTIGQYLMPERVGTGENLTEEFGMTQYLTEVVVRFDSPLRGKTVQEAFKELDLEADIVQLVRSGQVFNRPLERKEIQAADILVIRTDQESLLTLLESEGLELGPQGTVGDKRLDAEQDDAVEEQHLVEVVITPDTPLVGSTLEDMNFRKSYNATVLAIRRGGEIIHKRMDQRKLRGGDTLLIQGTEEAIQQFNTDRHFVVAQRLDRPDFRESHLPIAVGIVGSVILLAALGVMSIMVAALSGMIVMVLTGCVRPEELYASVDWSVIFLLAGLIPLGIAMENTGGAEWLAYHLVAYPYALGASSLVILGLFYLFTALITNVISNNASVVLMLPVAVEAAEVLGSEPFSFAMAVTFASSTAFMTPIGYQTNLMVYGPGGYKFTDFIRVGTPLQLIMTVVTALSIWMLWGI